MLPLVRVLAVLLMVGCSSPNTAGRHKALLPDVLADASVEAIATQPGASLSEETLVADGIRPRFHHQIFSVVEQDVFGVPTALRIEFFNGELMQVDLTPQDQEQISVLASALASMYGVADDDLRDGVDVHGVRLRQSKDAAGQAYVSIGKIGVLERFRDWLAAYS